MNESKVKLLIFNAYRNSICSFEGSTCSNFFQTWRPPVNLELDGYLSWGDTLLFDYKFKASIYLKHNRRLLEDLWYADTGLVSCFYRNNSGPSGPFFHILEGINSEADTLFMALDPHFFTNNVCNLINKTPKSLACLARDGLPNENRYDKWITSRFVTHPRDFDVDISAWVSPFMQVANKLQACEILSSKTKQKERYEGLKKLGWRNKSLKNFWATERFQPVQFVEP